MQSTTELGFRSPKLLNVLMKFRKYLDEISTLPIFEHIIKYHTEDLKKMFKNETYVNTIG